MRVDHVLQDCTAYLEAKGVMQALDAWVYKLDIMEFVEDGDFVDVVELEDEEGRFMHDVRICEDLVASRVAQPGPSPAG